MKRSFAALVLSAAIAAAVPTSAQAQAEVMCGDPGAHVCVTALFTLTGTNTLNVYLFNGSLSQGINWASVVTGFEIGGLPSGGTWALSGVSYNDWNGVTNNLDTDGNTAFAATGKTTDDCFGDWCFDTSIPGLVGITGQAGANGPSGNGGFSTCAGPSGTDQLQTCEGDGTGFGTQDDWMKFSFSYTSGGLDGTTLSSLDWGYKAQDVQGLDGTSLECQDASAGTDFCESDSFDLTKDINVTPEPATMGLMALGLVGLAAASKRRRREH